MRCVSAFQDTYDDRALVCAVLCVIVCVCVCVCDSVCVCWCFPAMYLLYYRKAPSRHALLHLLLLIYSA